MVAVGPAQVPVELIGSDLFPEIQGIAIVLDVEELRFFVGVEGFHVGVRIGMPGKVQGVMGAEDLFHGVGESFGFPIDDLSVEFGAPVRPHPYFARLDSNARQVFQAPADGRSRIGDGDFACKTREDGPGPLVPEGVLKLREPRRAKEGIVPVEIVGVFHVQPGVPEREDGRPSPRGDEMWEAEAGSSPFLP